MCGETNFDLIYNGCISMELLKMRGFYWSTLHIQQQPWCNISCIASHCWTFLSALVSTCICTNSLATIRSQVMVAVITGIQWRHHVHVQWRHCAQLQSSLQRNCRLHLCNMHIIKKLVNRLIFDKMMAMSLWPHFFGIPCMAPTYTGTITIIIREQSLNSLQCSKVRTV